ncbi:hypothetical protein OII53_28190 [Achromobacter ruhlandii]|uniref:hypothetical protein n=1 Tax=Achromobacter TaxID=222 RepID=UPI0012E2D275|nr:MULTISPECIES: hypothetical protein [Achromobacter]MCV6799868.1 hypothetical protein [Achromobacter ruhlandii]MCV6801422.1 hypothetical protein [Achromobacter ruhlandii]MCV6812343.1 hypothetical protein [Achromobacter ruhlandii]MCV6822456.1 hypothetical protein [Achromobacter ruhlandii]
MSEKFNPVSVKSLTITPHLAHDAFPTVRVDIPLEHTQSLGTEAISLSLLLPLEKQDWTELQRKAVERAIAILQSALAHDQQR